MRRGLGVLVVSVLLVPTFAVEVPTAEKYVHPGIVVDAYSRKGIMAEAYAYGSQSPNNTSGCPTYANSLDSQRSSPATGNFAFHIDSQVSGYLTVYCQQGYAPRTETANDNSSDSTRVQPDPVTLFPLTSPLNVIEVASRAIEVDLESLSANLRYYREASPEAFGTTVQSSGFSDEDRKIISTVLQLRQSGTSISSKGCCSQKSIGNPQIAIAATAADLNHVRSDLGYYRQVDEHAYSTALGTVFSREERETLELIRTRTRSFGPLSPILSPPSKNQSKSRILSSPSENPDKDVKTCAGVLSVAWNEFNRDDFTRAIAYAEKCVQWLKDVADQEQDELGKKGTPIPPTGKVSPAEKQAILMRGPLNDVATSVFIIGSSEEKMYRHYKDEKNR